MEFLMKKIFVAVLALVFILGAGCSSSDATNKNNSDVTATAANAVTSAAVTADGDGAIVTEATSREEAVTASESVKAVTKAAEVVEKKEIKPVAAKEDVETASVDGEVKWEQFNAGLKQAKLQEKHMLVDFYTDWCHWCKVMDEKTFSDKDVSRKLASRFVTVRLNAEAQNEMLTYKGQNFSNAQFTKVVKVTGFPSLGFFDKNGEIVTIVPGFIPPESFIHILGYIDGEYYKKDIPFDEYVKQQEG